MNRRKHRPGELDAMYFDKLPQRCKEMFFEFLSCEFPYDVKSKEFFVDICPIYVEECKSPIEQIFIMAFNMVAFSKYFNYATYVNLYPQEDIYVNGKHYVADFLFDTDFIDVEDHEKKINPFKLVIECDGHETHHSTKEQVKKDNERDFNLKKAGYDVLHFSGSQIFNEPYKCAEEVLDYIVGKTFKA